MKRGRPKTIVWREAERLALMGVESPDIVTTLKVPPAVQQQPEFQARLAQIVEMGHAQHRINVARRLEREGIRRGKPHSLLALARNRLKFDQAKASELEGLAIFAVVQGAAERVMAQLERIIANRVEQGQDGHPSA